MSSLAGTMAVAEGNLAGVALMRGCGKALEGRVLRPRG